jgi:hypothetical protein
MGFDFAETSCVLGSRLARSELMQKGAVQFVLGPFEKFHPKQLVKRSFERPRQVTALAYKYVKTSDEVPIPGYSAQNSQSRDRLKGHGKSRR